MNIKNVCIPFLLTFFMNISLSASSLANFDLPANFMSVDEMVAEFRNVFVDKIKDLNKNFILRNKDFTNVYLNNKITACMSGVIAQNSPITQNNYHYTLTDNSLVEVVTYLGCKDDLAIRERVFTKGRNLKPLTIEEFTKGIRRFDLNDHEEYREYKILNELEEEIVKVVLTKQEGQKVIDFYSLGQKFFSLKIIVKKNLGNDVTKEIFYHYLPSNITYVRKYSRLRSNSKFPEFYNRILVNDSKDVSGAKRQSITYRNNLNEEISPKTFLENFTNYFLQTNIQTIINILEYHNYYFPITDQVQSGSKNENFKEELRLMLNRLQTNTDLTLVRRKIQEYLEAAEKNTIIDNRPKN